MSDFTLSHCSLRGLGCTYIPPGVSYGASKGTPPAVSTISKTQAFKTCISLSSCVKQGCISFVPDCHCENLANLSTIQQRCKLQTQQVLSILMTPLSCFSYFSESWQFFSVSSVSAQEDTAPKQLKHRSHTTALWALFKLCKRLRQFKTSGHVCKIDPTGVLNPPN